MKKKVQKYRSRSRTPDQQSDSEGFLRPAANPNAQPAAPQQTTAAPKIIAAPPAQKNTAAPKIMSSIIPENTQLPDQDAVEAQANALMDQLQAFIARINNSLKKTTDRINSSLKKTAGSVSRQVTEGAPEVRRIVADGCSTVKQHWLLCVIFLLVGFTMGAGRFPDAKIDLVMDAMETHIDKFMGAVGAQIAPVMDAMYEIPTIGEHIQQGVAIARGAGKPLRIIQELWWGLRDLLKDTVPETDHIPDIVGGENKLEVTMGRMSVGFQFAKELMVHCATSPYNEGMDSYLTWSKECSVTYWPGVTSRVYLFGLVGDVKDFGVVQLEYTPGQTTLELAGSEWFPRTANTEA